jgi:arylsulfatase A-like enzyme
MPSNSPHSSVARRTFLGTAAAGAALAQTNPKRPNIIYIHSHDTGRYLEPYGHAVPAPNLQRLASQGVLFRQAFNAGPTCSPSRASLLTGMCPHSNGMFGLAHRGFVLNDYKQHILHTLRPAGYYSALFGVQHIASKPATIGYDKFETFPGNHVEPVSASISASRKRIASSASPVRRKIRASACLPRRFRIRPKPEKTSPPSKPLRA